MVRGTTPTLSFKINNINPLDVSHIVLTMQQRGFTLNKKATLDAESIANIDLSKEETLAFFEGAVNVQAVVNFTNGKIMATKATNITVDKLLSEEALEV